jgi:hypothetical protein
LLLANQQQTAAPVAPGRACAGNTVDISGTAHDGTYVYQPKVQVPGYTSVWARAPVGDSKDLSFLLYVDLSDTPANGRQRSLADEQLTGLSRALAEHAVAAAATRELAAYPPGCKKGQYWSVSRESHVSVYTHYVHII